MSDLKLSEFISQNAGTINAFAGSRADLLGLVVHLLRLVESEQASSAPEPAAVDRSAISATIAEKVVAHLHTLDGLNPCLRRAPEDHLRDLQRDVAAIVNDVFVAASTALPAAADRAPTLTELTSALEKLEDCTSELAALVAASPDRYPAAPEEKP